MTADHMRDTFNCLKACRVLWFEVPIVKSITVPHMYIAPFLYTVELSCDIKFGILTVLVVNDDKSVVRPVMNARRFSIITGRTTDLSSFKTRTVRISNLMSHHT